MGPMSPICFTWIYDFPAYLSLWIAVHGADHVCLWVHAELEYTTCQNLG